MKINDGIELKRKVRETYNKLKTEIDRGEEEFGPQIITLGKTSVVSSRARLRLKENPTTTLQKKTKKSSLYPSNPSHKELCELIATSTRLDSLRLFQVMIDKQFLNYLKEAIVENGYLKKLYLRKVECRITNRARATIKRL